MTSSRWTAKNASADFYDVDVAWDRNSNVVSAQDNLWKNSSGNRQFDALFTVDDLNRLTAADEGTLSGTIANRSRKQEWTLSQAGNWVLYKMDLNGNVNYSDSGEYNDTETFNDANELLTRDTDSNASVNYTQTHDEVGNLTDDGKDYEYFYDVFGRLREVRRTSNQTLIAEYRYNGLGHRIGWHYDADADNDTDGSDPWYWFAYDERWRMVATFRDGSAPIEIFTNHCAGRGGYGGSSALDAVICRDKNLDNGWLGGLTEEEGLEERVYFCHNWRNDVVAVVSSSGQQRVSQRYSAYGVPFAAPAGDLDADGDCDGSDSTILTAWIAAPLYDVRGDLDLDGDLDATDQSTLTGTYSGVSLGRGKLSRGVDLPAGGIRKGYAGYEHDGALLNMSFAHVRNRVYMAEIGRWTRRDPLGYVDGMSLYEYVSGGPMNLNDPMGLGGGLEGCGYDGCRRGRPGPNGGGGTGESLGGGGGEPGGAVGGAGGATGTGSGGQGAGGGSGFDCSTCFGDEPEWIFWTFGPYMAWAVRECRNFALESSGTSTGITPPWFYEFPGVPTWVFWGHRNAYRHCALSCCMKAKIGYSYAMAILYHHEDCNILCNRDGTAAERQLSSDVDNFNNHVGAGTSCINTLCCDGKCRDHLMQGRLRVEFGQW